MISSVYTGMIIVTMGNDALIALQDTKQHTHSTSSTPSATMRGLKGVEYRPPMIYRNSNEQTKHKFI